LAAAFAVDSPGRIREFHLWPAHTSAPVLFLWSITSLWDRIKNIPH